MKISREIALEVFNLKEGYTDEELKSAYRRLSKICHPDTGGDQNLFVFITSCKDLLEETIKYKSKGSTQNDIDQKESKSKSSTEANCVKERIDIDLEKLIGHYTSGLLNVLMRHYEIEKIFFYSAICMYPRLKKSEKKNYTFRLESVFNKINWIWYHNTNCIDIDVIESIIVPEEFKKLKKIRVEFEFMDKTYKFTISKSKKKHVIKCEIEGINFVVNLNFDF